MHDRDIHAYQQEALLPRLCQMLNLLKTYLLSASKPVMHMIINRGLCCSNCYKYPPLTLLPLIAAMHDRDYHFTTKHRLLADIRGKKFLEAARVTVHSRPCTSSAAAAAAAPGKPLSYWYGTSLATVREVAATGKLCVMSLDMQGAQVIPLVWEQACLGQVQTIIIGQVEFCTITILLRVKSQVNLLYKSSAVMSLWLVVDSVTAGCRYPCPPKTLQPAHHPLHPYMCACRLCAPTSELMGYTCT